MCNLHYVLILDTNQLNGFAIGVKVVQKLKDDGNAAFKSGKFEEAIGKYGECLEVLFFFTVSHSFLKKN